MCSYWRERFVPFFTPRGGMEKHLLISISKNPYPAYAVQKRVNSWVKAKQSRGGDHLPSQARRGRRARSARALGPCRWRFVGVSRGTRPREGPCSGRGSI